MNENEYTELRRAIDELEQTERRERYDAARRKLLALRARQYFARQERCAKRAHLVGA